jgi:glycosyltransferase involved in cell wall biosynthesis
MKINLITPICYTGYGVAGTNILKSLTKLGHEISLFPIGGIATHEENIPLLQTCINRAQLEFDVNAPCIKIWHQHDMAQFVGKNKHIGFPIFELDTFNPLEKHHLESCDELFVCSAWAKQICRNNGISKPIHVIPLGVDRSIFYNSDLSGLPGQDAYIFFNCGKWEIRKGHDILVTAFNKAFTPEDNVRLWMLPNNPFLKPEQIKEWENLYMNSEMGKVGKIMLIPPCPNHYHVAGLMRQAHCGVFPSRAEGWNLELLEMMSCGKPVIATNYSAHTEFCTKERNNCSLIEIQDKEDAYDAIWFHNQGKWAKLTETHVNELAENMKTLYLNKEKNNPAGIETSREFTWKNTAQKIIQAIG